MQIAEHLLDARRQAARRRLQHRERGRARTRCSDHLDRSGRDVDVIGVLAPAAQQAVAATRTGRIGLLATPATVASGAYERAVRAADPHVHVEQRRLPGSGAR